MRFQRHQLWIRLRTWMFHKPFTTRYCQNIIIITSWNNITLNIYIPMKKKTCTIRNENILSFLNEDFSFSFLCTHYRFYAYVHTFYDVLCACILLPLCHCFDKVLENWLKATNIYNHHQHQYYHCHYITLRTVRCQMRIF